MPVITVTLDQVNDTTTQAHIRNHEVTIDRPEAKGGRDEGGMGGELLLAALGGCFNSNLLEAIRTRELPINDIHIEVHGNLVDHPKRFDSIEMVVRSDYGDRAEFEKLVTISERSCIVANSLRDGLDLTIRTETLAAQSSV